MFCHLWFLQWIHAERCVYGKTGWRAGVQERGPRRLQHSYKFASSPVCYHCHWSWLGPWAPSSGYSVSHISKLFEGQIPMLLLWCALNPSTGAPMWTCFSSLHVSLCIDWEAFVCIFIVHEVSNKFPWWNCMCLEVLITLTDRLYISWHKICIHEGLSPYIVAH